MTLKSPPKPYTLLGAFLLAALGACTRPASLTPAPQQAAPSAIPTSAEPANAIPTPTTSPTMAPTATAHSVATGTPRQGPASPTPTPDLSLYNRQASISQSPQGRYQARVIVSFPETPQGETFGDQYHTLVQVTDLEQGGVITLVDLWSYTGLGLTTPRILGWAPEGQALYLADSGVPDGCGPPFTENIRRVDLPDGQVTPLDLTIRGPWTLSPGVERLGFVDESDFVAFDLNTHAQERVPFTPPQDDWWPTSLSWSPAGDMALFTMETNPCGAPENRQGWTVKVDIPSADTQALLRDDPRTLSLLSWPLEGYAQMSDPQGTTWWMDTLSGDVAQAAPSQVAQAHMALTSFFEALNQSRYAEAERWFGGSYQILQDNNPNIDPDDHSALWQAACEFNGFQCLRVNQAILEAKPSQDEYRFRASFLAADGGLFVRGPCCGASEIDMPPQWEFPFIVARDESGQYLVQDLPVYVP